jgi:fatty-acyl-CoA synthase
MPEMEVTGTFKYRKADMVEAGFDPAKVSDPIYFDDSAAGAYTLLDPALYQRICAGGVRL